MNKPIIYLPISFLVILCILYISLSVPSFNLLLHFFRLIYLAIPLSLITAIIVYFRFKDNLDFDNLYVMTGSTVLFSFVTWFALIAFCNREYATKNCNIASYEVIGYKGRMVSGYGKLEKGEIKANQWILTIMIEGEKKFFVLDQDIFDGNQVTNTMDLRFCKGLLGTEYLNLEQLPG